MFFIFFISLQFVFFPSFIADEIAKKDQYVVLNERLLIETALSHFEDNSTVELETETLNRKQEPAFIRLILLQANSIFRINSSSNAPPKLKAKLDFES